MLRKFILTVVLKALYEGSPSHMSGSLITIFIFLLGHVLLKPYVNQGLNVYQSLLSVNIAVLVIYYIFPPALSLRDPTPPILRFYFLR